jgi:hypothetical protein
MDYRFMPKCYINIYLYVLKNADVEKLRAFEVMSEKEASPTRVHLVTLFISHYNWDILATAIL